MPLRRRTDVMTRHHPHVCVCVCVCVCSWCVQQSFAGSMMSYCASATECRSLSSLLSRDAAILLLPCHATRHATSINWPLRYRHTPLEAAAHTAECRLMPKILNISYIFRLCRLLAYLYVVQYGLLHLKAFLNSIFITQCIVYLFSLCSFSPYYFLLY